MHLCGLLILFVSINEKRESEREKKKEEKREKRRRNNW